MNESLIIVDLRSHARSCGRLLRQLGGLAPLALLRRGESLVLRHGELCDLHGARLGVLRRETLVLLKQISVKARRPIAKNRQNKKAQNLDV